MEELAATSIGQEHPDASLAFITAILSGDSSASHHLHQVVATLRWSDNRQQQGDIVQRIHDQLTILQYMLIWKWLKAEISAAISSLTSGESHWLHSLCLAVCKTLETERSKVLHTKWKVTDYIKGMESDVSIANITFPGNRPPQAADTAIFEHTMSIL
jgi:hypothetical protein